MKNCPCSNLHKRQSLGAPNTVINWIENGIKLLLKEEIPSFEIPNKTFSAMEESFLRSEISNLLLLGCITVAENRPYCVSPISCVPK